MFGRNTYHIPQVSHSSLNSRDSASVIDFNEADLFHHQHHHLLSGSYLTGNPPVNEAASSFSHDSGGGGIHGVPNSCPSKQAVKKDRHSKIYTSQGPRDRRVRLSIGIARKFFDLQEMLGVDKPSKTLDWLLTKSKTAIKDLVHTKQNTDKNDVSSSTAENNGETLENGKSVGKRKSAGKQKGGGGGGAKDPQVNLAKESRAKARARARERTREKMCIKQQQKEQLQQCMNNQIEICKISGTGNHNNNGFYLSAYEEANHQDMIQESIVIKRKVKHPSSILGFQQSCIISRDLTSGIPSSFPTSENWDANSFNPQANIYAIWDQHRFINSASNN